jgi:hypothetical protein
MLRKRGTFLAKRGAWNESVFLFYYEGWYVEIYYKRYRCTIKKIVISKNARVLEPYLDHIDIQGVYNLAR